MSNFCFVFWLFFSQNCMLLIANMSVDGWLVCSLVYVWRVSTTVRHVNAMPNAVPSSSVRSFPCTTSTVSVAPSCQSVRHAMTTTSVRPNTATSNGIKTYRVTEVTVTTARHSRMSCIALRSCPQLLSLRSSFNLWLLITSKVTDLADTWHLTSQNVSLNVVNPLNGRGVDCLHFTIHV